MSFEVCDDECAFHAVERALEGMFPRTARAGVSFAELGEARTSGCPRANGGIERIAGEGVANADMSIEVGEWGDEHWVADVAIDDDGQPESELAEPDGGRVDVDAEDRLREHVASDLPHRARVAEFGAERGKLLEDVDEEGAASAGGIEDGDGCAAIAEGRGIAIVRHLPIERITRGVRADGVGREGLGERGVANGGDEAARCVKRASGTPGICFHEGFEGFAQHFRIDGGFGPIGGFFAR